MPAKQERYRKCKADQGFQRVELLVPQELVSHLKSYARALRDAHALGLAPPLFDGMKHQNGLQESEGSATLPTSLRADGIPIARDPGARPDFSSGLFQD